MRQVRIRATWESEHVLEVEDDHPKIEPDDLGNLLGASEDDIDSGAADLTAWEINDPGPKQKD